MTRAKDVADRGHIDIAIIADQKSSGTHGGTFTSGAWRTRDLNTEISDPDGIVSISSNQFTLAAGTYLIEYSAPGHDTDSHQTSLYDITGSAYLNYGTANIVEVVMQLSLDPLENLFIL